MPQSRWGRVLLKLSGEAFADSSIGSGIDAVVVKRLAEEVADATDALNVQIAIVVASGWDYTSAVGEINIWAE